MRTSRVLYGWPFARFGVEGRLLRPRLSAASCSGEAYDKIARLLGLDMRPNGGACLEALASRGDPSLFPFKTPMQKQVIAFGSPELGSQASRLPSGLHICG